MLNHKAFEKILSNKKGHKIGETEKLVLQAIRVVTNVKNRQTRAEDAGLALLEKLVEVNNLSNHKILLFLLDPGQIDPNIRGLVANKMMNKYQKPCCVLTYSNREGKETYDGSGRGYTKTGIESFKEVLEQCPGVIYVQGHDNAHGLSIKKE